MLQIKVVMPNSNVLEITSKNYKINRKKIEDSVNILKRKQNELEATIAQLDDLFITETKYSVIPTETVKEIQELITKMTDFTDSDSVVKTLLTESYKIVGYDVPKSDEKYKTHVLYKLCMTTSLSPQMRKVIDKMFMINELGERYE